MGIKSIKNKVLTVLISTHGAEIISVKNNETEVEYRWDAQPEYWGKHAPILFPFVGSPKDKAYEYKGITYPMTQHGFARDMEFTVVEQSQNSIWFSLSSTPETLTKYPFPFELRLG